MFSLLWFAILLCNIEISSLILFSISSVVYFTSLLTISEPIQECLELMISVYFDNPISTNIYYAYPIYS